MAKRWRNLPRDLRARLPEVLTPERRRELVEDASGASEGRLARIRAGAWPLFQIAAAATLAWLFAARVLGHPDAYFAPTAAIIALAATRGQRVRQALEMTLGVAVGSASATSSFAPSAAGHGSSRSSSRSPWPLLSSLGRGGCSP